MELYHSQTLRHVIDFVNPKSSGLDKLFLILVTRSNYREVNIKIFNPQKMIIFSFSLSNMCFVCVKETSHGDVSFIHPNRMVL